MKKVKNIILWILSVFLLLMTAGLFTESIHGGLLMFAAAMLCNPLVLKLIAKGGKKIKPYVSIPAVIVLFFTAILTSPMGTAPEQEPTAGQATDVTQAAGQEDPASVLAVEREEIPEENTASSERNDPGTDSQPEAASLESVQADAAPEDTEPEETELTVHYLDVGQGDCMLLACDGEYMLIDAGDNSEGTAVQNYLTKQGVDRLRYVIGTHPDADHVGGLDVVLYKFDCETVMLPDVSKDTKTYRDVLDTMDRKGYRNTLPEAGQEFLLGGAVCTVLGPRVSYEDANNCSVVLLVSHGANRFLFMGDAEAEAEEDILRSGADVKADVIKVGHHGSRYSSSKAFLEAVSPSYAVISCGEDNSYGHPHAETLNNLRAMGVEVFRSDEQGTVVAVSDGSRITWNSAPSDTWKAGEPKGGSDQAESGRAEDDQPDGSRTQNSQPESRQAEAESRSGQDGTESDGTAAEQEAGNGAAGSAAADGTGTVPPTQDSGQAAGQQEQWQAPDEGGNTQPEVTAVTAGNYIGNKNNNRLHKASCSYLPAEKNRAYFNTREEAVAAGYDIPCKKCNP